MSDERTCTRCGKWYSTATMREDDCPKCGGAMDRELPRDGDGCVHCGEAARYLFLASPGVFGLGERWEPICTDHQDAIGHKYTLDLCDCDEGHVCAYHEQFCPICERPRMKGSPLCRVCTATAKAHARMERDAREYPDPERWPDGSRRMEW